ncbi:hypothetical protein GNP35_05820 [Psychrosphaera haliotis]|uniref:Uncharacterized protein n=1 Tax=Psychrosphaera haliotis TaxID=555083 RepID=A0A6N8F734_9GAMM|nr:hypothetical protein [Psychrosphaera haliotis]
MLKYIFVPMFFFTVALPVKAKCLLEPKFIDAVLNLNKTMKAVKSFEVQSEFPYEGSVTKFPITYKFTALRLESKGREKQAFIFAFDLHNESFYVYYTDGISQPYPNLIEGKINLERCSIYFKASEYEVLEVYIRDENKMEIHSQSRDENTHKLSLKQKFVLSPN